MEQPDPTAWIEYFDEEPESQPFSLSSDVIYRNFSTENDPTYMIATYLSMGIFGVLGNVITCVVIATNRSMHSITNCYLFNLAVSDLIMLVFAFPSLNVYPKYSSEFICVFRGLFAECSVYVSVLTISTFSVERYLAICHPFRARALSRLSRVSIVIPAIWLVGLTCALSMSLLLGLAHHYKLESYALCTVTKDLASRVIEISTAVFFVLPMLLIGWMYAMIGLRVRENGRMRRSVGREGDDATDVDVRIDGNAKRVLKMLVTVVVAFFICWAPFHTQRLLSVHFGKIFGKEYVIRVKNLITYTSGILYYSSAVINPILYNIMSIKFRRAFKDTLVRCKIFRLNRSTDVIEL